MKIRFQADADLNEDIVKGVLRRELGIDFRTATSAGLRSLSDLEELRLTGKMAACLFLTIGKRCLGHLVSLSGTKLVLVCSSFHKRPIYL